MTFTKIKMALCTDLVNAKYTIPKTLFLGYLISNYTCSFQLNLFKSNGNKKILTRLSISTFLPSLNIDLNIHFMMFETFQTKLEGSYYHITLKMVNGFYCFYMVLF